MRIFYRVVVVIMSALFIVACSAPEKGHWVLVLKQPDTRDVEVIALPSDLSKPFHSTAHVDGVHVTLQLSPFDDYTSFKASASSNQPKKVILAMRYRYEDGVPFNFLGKVHNDEVFRQSPHDTNAWIVKHIAMQAVPVAGVANDSMILAAVSDSPAFYANATTQSFIHSQRYVEVASGDDGSTPGLKPDTTRRLDMDYNTDKTQVMSPGKIIKFYHPVSNQITHTFDGLLLTSRDTTVRTFRKNVNESVAKHFSGGKIHDYFGSLAFTTAYMNLRLNDSGKSKYWVVPSVEYANTQYCRDAFWISMMLSPEFSAECIKNELAVVNNYAEYPLVAIIWAYRAVKEKALVDLKLVERYVKAIESRAQNDFFYSYLESDGRLDFQYWGDVMAFGKTDVITYNQGLYALALRAANELGIATSGSPEVAAKNYRAMYHAEAGYFPISREKSVLGPDPVIPDLISQLYFGAPLLESDQVRSHFEKIVKKSKTEFGFKIVSSPEGDYLPAAMYDVPGYTSQVNREKMPDGRYFRGGSYFLYDNLFLIDAYLHGVAEAEDELIWRVSLDFSMGSTTFECLNTKTGEPWKPNMGWNVAVYAAWKRLVEEGRASDRLFVTVDQIVNKK